MISISQLKVNLLNGDVCWYHTYDMRYGWYICWASWFSGSILLSISSKVALKVLSSLQPSSALCCYPHVKLEIGNLSQITTTAPIFQQSHYFRQNIWRLLAAQIHFWIFIWIRVEHRRLLQLNQPKINESLSSLQARGDWNCGDEWTPASEQHIEYFERTKKAANIHIFQIPFSPSWGPRTNKLFWGVFFRTR